MTTSWRGLAENSLKSSFHSGQRCVCVYDVYMCVCVCVCVCEREREINLLTKEK